MVRRILGAILIACLMLLAAPARAGLNPREALPALPGGDYLLTRQYQITSARVPGSLSARQSVIAWQVTEGQWNGQRLDGLCIVLVQSVSEDGRSLSTTNCYVSIGASAEQRSALVGAFLSCHLSDLSASQIGSMRIEPAVITLQVEGQTVILHLGLVA